MIERATSPASIHSMLKTLQAYQTETAQGLQAPGIADPGRGVGKTGFADLVGNAVGQVNELQNQSRALQSAYERGESVPLTDVVLGMQKSSIAFEATLQVRNKVLKAYEDILNMPV